MLERESSLRRHDAIPAVIGSGTLDDLAKLAEHHCERPYVIITTAASMDGYTQARQIRSRCTIFDLAAETDSLGECVEGLFAPGGFWFEPERALF